MRLKLTILTLIYCLNSTAQTTLTQPAQNFCANETANGYTLRGQDIQALHHNTMDATISCLDNGQQTITLTNIVAWYPNIGNTLTSQTFNLINPYTDGSGIPAGQIVWTGTPTSNDGYITFNGSTQYGLVPNSSNTNATSVFNITGSITLMCWVNFNSFPSAQVICGRWSDGGYGYALLAIGSAIYASISNSGTSYVVGYPFSVTGTWTHLAMTFIPSSGVYLYINGSLVASNTISPPSAQSLSSVEFEIGFGNNNITPTYFLDGSIQDIIVSTDAYSATTIGYIYNWQLNNLGYANKR